MEISTIYVAYQHRRRIKRICIWVIILIASIAFVIYLVVATIFTVIQGNGGVVDKTTQHADTFSQFQHFTYKTIYDEQWFDFNHPYFFPTLGSLTQGVILDSSAKVGLKHIAWDIADHVDRQTEVKAFADGIVVAVKNNILYNTTRRWKLCDTEPGGICWYEVTQTADVQIGCGYEVIIEHKDSLRSQYCHLASEPPLRVGDSVAGGQTIGYQGNTGWATGKHLHFALWREGKPIDPSYAFSQTSLSDWEQ
jgi:hypothetical protein